MEERGLTDNIGGDGWAAEEREEMMGGWKIRAGRFGSEWRKR